MNVKQMIENLEEARDWDFKNPEHRKEKITKVIEELKELKEELKEERSCCPNCGSHCWGRIGDYKDGKFIYNWEIRHCNNCAHEYPNP